jgi:hypothetical protein
MAILRSEKRPVSVVSLEMPEIEIGQRAISQIVSVDSYAIRRGRMTETDFMRFSRGVGQLSELPLTLIRGSNLTVDQIRSRARRLHWQAPLGLLVVDYLQLVAPTQTSRTRNREAEVAEISRGLKTFALELGIPVLALSQLNRDATQREPRVSDLRESGAIEQDADTIVLFAADQGLALGSHGLLGKQNLYEHSMRSPVVLAGPGVPAGRRLDALAYLFDVPATVGALAGVPPPAAAAGPRRGPGSGIKNPLARRV